MASDERYEGVVRKALKDSAALPSSTDTYDPPNDPELREIYDDIYSLAADSAEQHTRRKAR